jgi:hypothetical protein
MTPARILCRLVSDLAMLICLCVMPMACHGPKVVITPVVPIVAEETPTVGAASPQTPLQQTQAWVREQIVAGKTSPTINSPNCMLPAKLDAVSVAGGGFSVTLVHPQIVEFSMHFPVGIGWTMDFGGQTYTTTKIASVGTGPDIAYALLDRPVVGVQPMRTLLAPAPDMLKLPVFWYTYHRNKMQLLEVASFNANWTTHYVGKAITTTVPTDTTWRIGTTLISGDSGSPLITRIDGEWVLLCTAQSPRAGSGIHNYYAWAADLCQREFGVFLVYRTITLKAGDANDDNICDFKDFIILSNNYGKATDQGHNAGDFDRDGVVGFTDFTLLSNNFGK